MHLKCTSASRYELFSRTWCSSKFLFENERYLVTRLSLNFDSSTGIQSKCLKIIIIVTSLLVTFLIHTQNI